MLAVKLYDEGLPGRLAAHAYDFLIMMLGAWVLFPQARWLSLACFVLACIGADLRGVPMRMSRSALVAACFTLLVSDFGRMRRLGRLHSM